MNFIKSQMQKATNAYQHSVDAVQTWYRTVTADKAVIKQLATLQHAHEDLRLPSKSTKETASSPLEEFKRHSSSISLRVTFNKHPDLLAAGIKPFKHTEALNRYFRDLSAKVKSDDVQSLAEHISNRGVSVMLQSISIEAGHRRDAALQGVQFLTNICKDNDRITLFKTLEKNNFLERLLEEQAPKAVAKLLTVMFESATAEETAKTLKTSTTWENLENKAELIKHLTFHHDKNIHLLIPKAMS
jgi:hypothetical protein